MTLPSVLSIKLTALITIVIAGFFLVVNSYAEEEEPSLQPRCGQTDFNMCGFIDADKWENGGETVFIIEPIYERADNFSEGLAAVRVDGEYGYIDTSGKFVIPTQFGQAGVFDQGLAIAGSHERLGVIDRAGNYVVQPMFEKAVVLNEDVILGRSARQGDGPMRADLHDSLASPYSLSSLTDAGLYHVNDGWLTQEVYGFDRFDENNRRLIWAQVAGGKRGSFDDLYGLMRDDGTWLTEPKYSYGTELKYDRAPVRVRKDGVTISGAIDGQGREVIPFKFDYLTHWEQGFLMAGQGAYPNRKFGIVNRGGELLAGRYFDEIERADNVLGPNHPQKDFFTVKDKGEWKTLTQDGNLVADQRIGDVFLQCNGFEILYSSAGYDLKPSDKNLPTVTFDEPLFSSSDQKCNPPPTLIRDETYAAILDNGSVFGGFFENGMGFFGTHRWVSVDAKWGLVSADGTFEVSPIYDSVQNQNGFGDGNDAPNKKTDTTYKVSIGDQDYRLSFLDNEYLREPFVEPEAMRKGNVACRGGYKRKFKDGMWGIVDKNGKDFIAPNYRAISCFSSGTAWVPDDIKRQWCPIDKTGRVRVSIPCRERYYPYSISHHYPESFDPDAYESNVLWVRAWLDFGEGRRNEKPKFISYGNGG